jgi:hypothetical protein
MSDPKKTALDELLAAREQVDTLVNSLAPSSDEEVAEVRSLRERSEALTVTINDALAQPIPGLTKGMAERISELKRASDRLLRIEHNIIGVKEAIALTDQIVALAVQIVTPDP